MSFLSTLLLIACLAALTYFLAERIGWRWSLVFFVATLVGEYIAYLYWDPTNNAQMGPIWLMLGLLWLVICLAFAVNMAMRKPTKSP